MVSPFNLGINVCNCAKIALVNLTILYLDFLGFVKDYCVVTLIIKDTSERLRVL